MPFNTRLTDPTDARVIIPMRVSWRARAELHELAQERGVSLNQLLTDAVNAATGIELT